MKSWLGLLVAALALSFVLMVLAGCSGMKIEGECTYTRTITTSYTCPADGKLEHNRLSPWNPEL